MEKPQQDTLSHVIFHGLKVVNCEEENGVSKDVFCEVLSRSVKPASCADERLFLAFIRFVYDAHEVRRKELENVIMKTMYKMDMNTRNYTRSAGEDTGRVAYGGGSDQKKRFLEELEESTKGRYQKEADKEEVDEGRLSHYDNVPVPQIYSVQVKRT